MEKQEIKGYEDLKVWQTAMQLAESVYALQTQFPKEERYALCDQLRRAAVSVPCNIAEGSGRETKADFLHFLAMARGSLYEVQTQVELAKRLGMVSDCLEVEQTAASLCRLLNAFMKKLRSSTHR